MLHINPDNCSEVVKRVFELNKYKVSLLNGRSLIGLHVYVFYRKVFGIQSKTKQEATRWLHLGER